jgi:glycosyltransferase involved in cell wall biosynthesis
VKKVLIITYYWPPSGGSGVQRWLYFAKYLEENGIIPIVVTVDPKKAVYPSFDNSLLEHVKHVITYSTNPGFNLFGLYSFLKSGRSKKIVISGDIGGNDKNFLDKFSSFVRANFFIPDARIGWNKHAISIAKKILSEEKIDWIITTGPPHSSHLIGLELKKLFAIHWVADFRDPWHDIYYNKLFKRSKKADNKDLILESKVLTNVDTILTVGPSMKSLLISKSNELEKKCFFIYNGYDEKAFEILSKKQSDIFTIAHIGIWTLQQAHNEIIEALTQILSTQSNLKIKFVLVGKVNEIIQKRLSEIPNLILEVKGNLNHKAALQEMKNADLLLNCHALMDNSKLLISGKLMEYIASGNPIVLIGNKNGDAAQLLKEIENSFVVSPDEIKPLMDCILKLIKEYPYNETIRLDNLRYSRTETTKELVKLLNSRKAEKS